MEEPYTTCAFCRRSMPAEEALYHLCDPEGALVVNVWNMRATLARVVREDDGRVSLRPLSRQPPEGLLERAVWEAGGAINISGLYPANDELERWAEEGGE